MSRTFLDTLYIYRVRRNYQNGRLFQKIHELAKNVLYKSCKAFKKLHICIKLEYTDSPKKVWRIKVIFFQMEHPVYY